MANTKEGEAKTSRRNFLTGLTATAATGFLLKNQAAAQIKDAKKSERISVNQDGTYDVVPLAKNAVMLGVVQARVRAFGGGERASRHKR